MYPGAVDLLGFRTYTDRAVAVGSFRGDAGWGWIPCTAGCVVKQVHAAPGRALPDSAWMGALGLQAAYVVGTLLVLLHEKPELVVTDSISILVESAVPEGKGVSSSAAIEVATMAALAAAYDVTLEPTELAVLCQKVRVPVSPVSPSCSLAWHCAV